MNPWQRIALLGGACVCVFALLFPPWLQVRPIMGIRVTSDAGYAPIWSPPNEEGGLVRGIQIDSTRLTLEVIVIAIVTTALLFLMRQTSSSRQYAGQAHTGCTNPDLPAAESATTPPTSAGQEASAASVPRAILHEQIPPTNWLFFYTYFRLPLVALVSMANIATMTRSKYLPLEAAMYMNVALVIAYVFLLVGLSNRRRWGWKLNWLVLVAEILLKAAERTRHDYTEFFVVVVVLLVLWFLPNAIYFGKRRHLFT